MVLFKLREHLDSNGVKYIVIAHSQAFTAQEIAAAAHIPGRELAKTVMLKLDGKMVMAVVPASDMVDFKLLRRLTDSAKIELASEEEFRTLFPGCETGAMPPFGNLYGMDVFAAQQLANDENIAFNAGTHRELIRLPYADFVRLVQPKVLDFSIRRRSPDEAHWKFEAE